MTAALPVPLSRSVLGEMMDVIVDLGHYMDPADERLVAWGDALEKVLKTPHAVEGLLALAFRDQVTGDIEGAERLLARADTRTRNGWQVDNVRLLVYLNLGFASRALEVARRLAADSVLDAYSGIDQAMISGGFGLMRDFIAKAQANGVDLSPVSQLPAVRKIVEGTEALGVADDQYSAVLDAAGEVMRARRLFWIESTPRMAFDPYMRRVSFRYRLKVTPCEASDITGDFVQRLIDRGLDQTVPLVVSFVGVLPDEVPVVQEEAATA